MNELPQLDDLNQDITSSYNQKLHDSLKESSFHSNYTKLDSYPKINYQNILPKVSIFISYNFLAKTKLYNVTNIIHRDEFIFAGDEMGNISILEVILENGIFKIKKINSYSFHESGINDLNISPCGTYIILSDIDGII